MEKLYDYLVVGSGLFGATFTHFATKAGKRVLVIEKRDHIGGNIYTESICDINVHKYGAHIFHTSNKEIWDFINTFARFNSLKITQLQITRGHFTTSLSICIHFQNFGGLQQQTRQKKS